MPLRSYIIKSFLFVALLLSQLPSIFSQCSDPVAFRIDEFRGVEGDIVCVEVKVIGFQDISSFLIPLSFDPNVLRYVSCANGPNFIFDCELGNTPDRLQSGTVQLFWNFSRAEPNVSLADEDVLIELCFEVIGDVGSTTKVIPGDVPPLGNIPGVIMEIFKGDCSDPADDDDIEVGDFRVTCGSLDIGNTVCPSSAGSNNGSVRFFLCGGEAPYTYDLAGTGISGSAEELEEIIISDLGPGDYSLLVQNRDGVTVALPGGGNFTIEQGDPVEIIDIETDGPACPAANANGFINITATGGVPPYSYKWSTTEVDINPLTMIDAGDYSVTVTDQNGCKVDTNQITIEYNRIELLNVIPIEASCANSRTGSVMLEIDGGNPERRTGGILRYRVSLNGERAFPYISQNPILNLNPGDYDVRIFDNSAPAQSCFIDASFTINASKNFELDLTPANNDCTAGGVVNVNTRALSGSGPLSADLTYRIFDQTGAEVQMFNSSDLNFQFTGLDPGAYTVSVTDNVDGCVIISDQNNPANVPQSSGSGLPITADVIQPSCGVLGTITILGLNDPSDYTYLWNDGLTTPTNEREGLSPNNYNVVVTETATGCSGTLTSQVEIRDQSINLNFNNPASIDTVVNSLSCFGDPGSITVDIQDPITRSMATYTWFEDGNVIAGETEMTITNLSPGNYSVAIAGGDICPITEDFVIGESRPIELNFFQDELSCFGQPANFSFQFTNNTGVTNFSIQNVETQEFLAQKNFFTSSDNVSAGTYQILGQDEVGCPIDELIVVGEYPELLIQAGGFDTIDNSCFGFSEGRAMVNPALIAGGAGGEIFYSWFETNNPDVTLSNSTSVDNLSNGNYTFTFFDAVCEGRVSFEITSPENIKIDDVNTLINQPSCFNDGDGGASLIINGGSGTFDLFRTTNIETGVIDPFFTNTITGLPAGTYAVQITDDVGCAGLDTIMITQPDSLITMVDSSTVVNLSCNAENFGIIRTFHTGGNDGTLIYTWSHDPTLNSPVATNLGEGVYTLMVEDINGCSDITEFEMLSPQPITLSNFDTLQFVQCFGDRFVFGGLEPAGGTNSGFRYSINNGNLMSVSDSILLSAGTYDLEIRDQDGCPLDTVFTILEPNEVVVELGPDVEINLGDSHTLRAEHDPEEIINFYEWNPLDPDESQPGQAYTVTPMDDTVYGVRIENSDGCADEDEVMIRVRRDRNIYIPNIITTGINDANASFSIYAGQGVESIEYLRVFDRWGNLVHEEDQMQGNPLGSGVWDARLNGRLVEPGVYVYIARVVFADGEILEYKGDVTVIH